MSSHLLSKARHDREPWGIGLLARWVWKALRTPFTKFNRWRRLLRIRHGGVDHTWWWHDRIWLMILKLLTVFLALIFLAWLIRALIVVIDRSSDANEFPFGFSPDKWCNARNVECGALTGWVTSLLSIALASAVFLLWRLSRTRHSYLHTARRYPRELVPTAGTVIGKIVGRDQLCRAVMEDLRGRSTRRPHVLVGGVGTGKTAVLVQMTELLAKRHAVPVPIRLREVGELDFTDLAKKRFLDEIDERLSSASEGERTWRRLLRDGRIVVLADGLEEALSDDIKDPERKAGERDTQIRNAIREAHKRRLPLFIASRPHSPLRGMDATIHELEPLSENDALSYVTEDTPTEDDWRLSWIVDTADVAEAPLYLQVTRELSRLDMLDHIVTREDQVLQTSTHDRATLRLRLLKTWDDAIIRGRLYPEVPLDRREREITLDWISALACIGLKDDSLEVSLDISVKSTLGVAVPRRHPLFQVALRRVVGPTGQIGPQLTADEWLRLPFCSHCRLKRRDPRFEFSDCLTQVCRCCTLAQPASAGPLDQILWFFGLTPRRYRHNLLARMAHLPAALASMAGSFDSFPLAVAGGASGHLHHGSQNGLAYLAHLSRAVTGLATHRGSAGFGPTSITAGAQLIACDFNFLFRAKHRLFKGQIQAVLQIATAAWNITRAPG